MTRTVALADDAYDDLASLKRPQESFSQLARRLAHEARVNDFFDRSLRVDMTPDEAEARRTAVRNARRETLTPRYQDKLRDLDRPGKSA